MARNFIRRDLLFAAMGMNVLTSFAADYDARKVRIVKLAPGIAGCPSSVPSEAFILGYRQARHDPETIENNCFQSLSEVPAIVARIVDSKPSVIVMVGSVAALRFAKEATSTIPIVFYDVTDPVSEGVVSSLGRPGGNITGLVNMSEEMHGKRMELLKDALPNITRVGLLGNLTNPSQANYLRALQQAARLLRLETKEYTVELPTDIPLAFQAMVRDRIQAMVLLPDSWFFPYRQDLLSLARAHRLPAMYANSTYPDLGGLFAYGASLTDMAFRGAGYVDRILKGARPSDIPIQQPTEFDLVVNARTARELGLSFSPLFQLRITRVVD